MAEFIAELEVRVDVPDQAAADAVAAELAGIIQDSTGDEIVSAAVASVEPGAAEVAPEAAAQPIMVEQPVAPPAEQL